MSGQRLGLVLRHAPELPLRGAAVALPDGAGVMLDLSLGLSFARAVTAFGLTLSDFSPCDQTIELLYLHEANSATTALSQHLTARLQNARAEAQAMTDPLTGLANRRAMDGEVTRALADYSDDFGLMQIDLDLFKRVNDSLGHAAGDAVLERVGDVLRQHLRLGDMAARVGGDEFIVLFRDCAAPDDLGRIAKRLISACEVPISYRGQMCTISASIGIASVRAYGQRPSLDQLLADADTAHTPQNAPGVAVLRFTAARPSRRISPCRSCIGGGLMTAHPTGFAAARTTGCHAPIEPRQSCAI